MDKRAEIEEQRTYYNRRWSDFKYVEGPKLKRCVAILDALGRTVSAYPSTIELGCGTGWLTNILGTFGSAVGVDLSDEAIAVARQRYQHIEFIAADLATWQSYPREHFDLVVSHEVIEHLEDQTGHLEMAYGLLKPGGHLILTTPQKRTCMAYPGILAYQAQPVEKWLNASELRPMLRSRFEIVELTTIIAGGGRTGIYRILSSAWVRAGLKRIGLLSIFDHLVLRCGCGAHILAIARKT